MKEISEGNPACTGMFECLCYMGDSHYLFSRLGQIRNRTLTLLHTLLFFSNRNKSPAYLYGVYCCLIVYKESKYLFSKIWDK